MSIVYLVRKKVFRTAEGVKQLYYAVQRVLQRRGGVTAELLAQRMASRKGMSSGDVQSVLIDLPKFIEEALMEGESVTGARYGYDGSILVRISRWWRGCTAGWICTVIRLADISLTICCDRKRCERSGPRERREFRMKTQLGWKMIRRTFRGRSER